MKVKELHEYLLSLYDLKSIGREGMADRIFFGDPESEIKKIGVCWLPYFSTLKEAHSNGINVMVVHEPAIYGHGDECPALAGAESDRAAKENWIRTSKMTLIRCHDILDAVPNWGIPFALGKALGYTNADIVNSRMYYNVYRLKKTISAEEVATHIARQLRDLKQPGVAFYGDPQRPVGTVGVGTGCYSNFLEMRGLGADLNICVNDSTFTWVQPVIAADTGAPMVIIDHGTSEEPGVKALAEHLQDKFPSLSVTHFPQGCTFKWIR